MGQVSPTNTASFWLAATTRGGGVLLGQASGPSHASQLRCCAIAGCSVWGVLWVLRKCPRGRCCAMSSGKEDGFSFCKPTSWLLGSWLWSSLATDLRIHSRQEIQAKSRFSDTVSLREVVSSNVQVPWGRNNSKELSTCTQEGSSLRSPALWKG